MKIYSMTATFGKLENQTLTLEPGLNIIHAPNEWGKSTWCAFLVTMLYGLDTRAKTTKNALADKNHYAPWSGSPMSGRMDIQWNGRDITIERRTKGRTPMGEFFAYETQTGLPVPQLTAANCGQTLLGVERSVFLRAGFLRLSDLPVTQDESLRRRLNALVTTGDESDSGDLLAQKLKELKNRCRYNRTGLIPQVEQQRDELEKKLQELQDLQSQSQKIQARHSELEAYILQLKNHQAALEYAASKTNAQRVSEAEAARDAAAEAYHELKQRCEELPGQETAQQSLKTAQNLQQQWMALQMERQMLPPAPVPPEIPDRYRNTPPEEAVSAALSDVQALSRLEEQKKHHSKSTLLVSIFSALALIILSVLQYSFPLRLPLFIGGCAAIVAVVVVTLLLGAAKTRSLSREIQLLYDRHPLLSPDRWSPDAESFAATQLAYTESLRTYRRLCGDLDSRAEALDAEIQHFTQGRSLTQAQAYWNQILTAWENLGNAHREMLQAQNHAEAMKAMAKPVEKPQYPDTLTFSDTDTRRLLSDATFEQRQLHLRYGQYQGKMEALGQASLLESQLNAANQRLDRLNETYKALEYAQAALTAATEELQRRFAPRIAKQAQDLFCSLTGGRYNRLTLAQDLSVNAGAEGENTLRAAQWRSEGTMDQLYLALRLAVARELTPDAPLILDDALVRFDDVRHAAAMKILKEEAEHKQVILFTCQNRETNI